jgi:hypothetical protein
MRSKADRHLPSPQILQKGIEGRERERCWVWQRTLNPSIKMLGRLECFTQEIALAKTRNQAISGTQ